MFNCRSCHSQNTQSIIPLGEQPLANGLHASSKIDQEPRYNLEVMLCQDCGLAQLRDLIDPSELFTDYVYFSSNSDTMLRSAADLVDRIRPTLSEDSLVVEIASNDGYLLKNYISQGIQVLGVDPAQNIAKFANENGIPTLCDFFNDELALKLVNEGKKADIIHANNVMAHVPDINSFVKGIKILLKEKGQAIIEVPYFADLVEKLEFDTIYHEHVYYFSVKPLRTVFGRYGLEIFDIEKIAIHGGTLRMFVGHKGAYPVQPVVEEMLDKEEKSNLYAVGNFKNFVQRIDDLGAELRKVLGNLKKQGAKIAAYGASAKGTTLLNYFKIDKQYLDFVVDRSLAKQGHYTPGTHLLIKSPSALIEDGANYALLLTWNFAEEILAQQARYRSEGGKFIIPLPVVRIV